MKRLMSLLIGALLSLDAFAALPPNCQLQASSTPEVALMGVKDTLYYVNNKHNQTVYLSNIKQSDLTTKISVNNWAVLALKEGDKASFACVESKPGAEQRVSCKGVVTICRLQKLKLPMTIIDNHWLVADVNLSQSYDALALLQISLA